MWLKQGPDAAHVRQQRTSAWTRPIDRGENLEPSDEPVPTKHRPSSGDVTLVAGSHDSSPHWFSAGALLKAYPYHALPSEQGIGIDSVEI